MRSPAELTDSFRARGLRITPQRVAVFEALHSSAQQAGSPGTSDQQPGHPTAESIYQSVVADMPSISLKTVYQTLNDLAEMGEIRRIDLGSTASRFDANLDEHHHLVCDSCGLMIDTYLDVSGIKLGDLGGFQPTGTSVMVSGLCPTCAASDAAAGRVDTVDS